MRLPGLHSYKYGFHLLLYSFINDQLLISPDCCFFKYDSSNSGYSHDDLNTSHFDLQFMNSMSMDSMAYFIFEEREFLVIATLIIYPMISIFIWFMSWVSQSNFFIKKGLLDVVERTVLIG